MSNFIEVMLESGTKIALRASSIMSVWPTTKTKCAVRLDYVDDVTYILKEKYEDILSAINASENPDDLVE